MRYLPCPAGLHGIGSCGCRCRSGHCTPSRPVGPALGVFSRTRCCLPSEGSLEQVSSLQVYSLASNQLLAGLQMEKLEAAKCLESFEELAVLHDLRIAAGHYH